MTTLINPANGETITEIPDTALEDVSGVVARTWEAFAQWREATPSQRSQVLLQVADLMEANAAELTRLEVEETGKPAAVAKQA